VIEQVALALACAGELLQRLELRLQAHGLLEGIRTCAQPAGLLGTAALVEQLELGPRDRELAVLVLAVKGHELGAQVTQLGDGGGAAVQVRPRAPVGAHAAGEHDLGRVHGQSLAKVGAEALGQCEGALDIGLARAGAHDSGPRATSEKQVERVGEHRLARPRLPGQHVQPGSQPQLGRLYQQQVLDAQL
jgi:hypothetical protein